MVFVVVNCSGKYWLAEAPSASSNQHSHNLRRLNMSINKGIKPSVYRTISIFTICAILMIALQFQAKAFSVQPQYFSGSLSSSSDVYTTNVTVNYSLTTYVCYGYLNSIFQ